VATTPDRIFASLLAGATLTHEQAQQRIAAALDVNYWTSLAPGLRITDHLTHSNKSDRDFSVESAKLTRDGYCRIRQAIDRDSLALVNTALDVVIAAKWPPVFAIVYDAVWNVVRSASTVQFARQLLGPDCRQIPKVWPHIVRPGPGASGYPPHVESQQPEGKVTAWIALTDVTVDDACMYVVSRAASPADDATQMLQDVTALPVDAGDMLVWSFDVLHWGGRLLGSRERRALSIELISSTATPGADETPTLSLAESPSFRDRLRLIAWGVRALSAREPLLRRFGEVADALR